MKETPLYQEHVALEAKMAPFAGFQMPLYYSAGAVEEHRVVRRSAGLFDVSHMGRFRITGEESTLFLDTLISSAVTKLSVGLSGYGLLLNEEGGILDDVFLYRLEESQYLLVVNASNLTKDWEWLVEKSSDYKVSLEDMTQESALLALQGPQVIPTLEKILGEDLSSEEAWPRFGAKELSFDGNSFLAGRTGYTGEDGVEIFATSSSAVSLWRSILENFKKHTEILPCGLAARDSLRFEPGFPLYGHELDETIHPPEALLKWACDFNSNFIGKSSVERLMQDGLTKKLITFVLLEKGVAREGYDILDENERVIGKVVSGLYCPTLDKYCGNGYVEIAFSKPEQEIVIQVRGKTKRAKVAKRPLYRPTYR